MGKRKVLVNINQSICSHGKFTVGRHARPMVLLIPSVFRIGLLLFIRILHPTTRTVLMGRCIRTMIIGMCREMREKRREKSRSMKERKTKEPRAQTEEERKKEKEKKKQQTNKQKRRQEHDAKTRDETKRMIPRTRVPELCRINR